MPRPQLLQLQLRQLLRLYSHLHPQNSFPHPLLHLLSLMSRARSPLNRPSRVQPLLPHKFDTTRGAQHHALYRHQLCPYNQQRHEMVENLLPRKLQVLDVARLLRKAMAFLQLLRLLGLVESVLAATNLLLTKVLILMRTEAIMRVQQSEAETTTRNLHKNTSTLIHSRLSKRKNLPRDPTSSLLY